MNLNDPVDLSNAEFLPKSENNHAIMFAVSVLVIAALFSVCRSTASTNDSQQVYKEVTYNCESVCMDYEHDSCGVECVE